MNERRCEDCLYWEMTHNTAPYGLCRRYPPFDDFPRSDPQDWCGEFKEKEGPRAAIEICSMEPYDEELEEA